MEIGQLRHRIELVNVVRVENAAGGYDRADTVEAVVWGHVAQASWSRQQQSERLEQRVTHTITIRWRREFAAGFGKEARARFTDQAGQTRELAIHTVIDPDERANWLELNCLEGGPT